MSTAFLEFDYVVGYEDAGEAHVILHVPNAQLLSHVLTNCWDRSQSQSCPRMPLRSQSVQKLLCFSDLKVVLMILSLTPDG